jgi:hypothetical protein
MKINNKGRQQQFFIKLLNVFGNRRQRLTIFTLAALLCCAGAVIATRAFSAKTPEPAVSHSKPTEVIPSRPNLALREAGRTSDYISHSALWSQLQDAFRILSNRLEKPGKERVIFSGTLEKTINSQTASLPFRLIWQLPGRLRLEEFTGGQTQVTVFDGTSISKLGGSLSQQDQDRIETLLYDSPEHFFIGRVQDGNAMRCLAGGLTMSGNEETGPVYEVYEVTDQIKATLPVRQQVKHFYFNSDTYQLERVRYQLKRGDSQTVVDVYLRNWTQYQDQRFPTQIVRLENGKPVLTLTINSIGISPKVDDGIFANLQR